MRKIARNEPTTGDCTSASSSSPIQCASRQISMRLPPNCFLARQIHSRRAKLLPRSPIDVKSSSFSTLQTIGHISCLCEMSQQSKRASTPAPLAGPPPGGQRAQPPAIPSNFLGAWCPPCPLSQPTMSSSVVNWLAGLQQPGMAGSSSTPGPWWAPTSISALVTEDSYVCAWYRTFPFLLCSPVVAFHLQMYAHGSSVLWSQVCCSPT
jgi:hypothetical protein